MGKNVKDQLFDKLKKIEIIKINLYSILSLFITIFK